MKASVLFSFVLALLLAANTALAEFSGGDGSADYPWQVATPEQLDAVRYDLAAHYILTADIDLLKATGEPTGAFWHGGNGWEPIGATLGSSFTGSIDGNGFKITGLFIDRFEKDQAGLFGWISYGAVLTGLALEAVDVSGHSLVGALAVNNFGGRVENSYVSGTVNGYEFVGGLVGRNHSGLIFNSYFSGSVSGFDNVGGLAASNWSDIVNSYFTGQVSGQSNVGALVGVSSTQVQDSYWNTETSGLFSSPEGGAGLVAAQMREQASFVGFDFDTTWHIEESTAFPVLANNPQDPSPGSVNHEVPGGTGQTEWNVIRSQIHDSDLVGTVFITATGVLNGGSVTGNISNLGRITGEVILEAGSTIRGGTISGIIEGIEQYPGVIRDARIVAGANLSNVLIGHGTVLDEEVRIGPNVKFMSSDSIPPGIDLTDALPALSWNAGDGRSVPDLSSDILLPDGETLPLNIIDSIQLPVELGPVNIRQDSSDGELILSNEEMLITLLPFRVRQASPGLEARVFINDDGNVVLVTGGHREVTAHPVVADSALLHSQLEQIGLELEYGEAANMRLFDTSGLSDGMEYLSVRADVAAVSASTGEEGLFSEEIAGSQITSTMYLVFSDESGVLMQQELVSMPADWKALKTALTDTGGMSNVRLSPQGIVSMESGDHLLSARQGYEVLGGVDGNDWSDVSVLFEPAGDINQDGTIDYQVVYPNGHSQSLMVLP